MNLRLMRTLAVAMGGAALVACSSTTPKPNPFICATAGALAAGGIAYGVNDDSSNRDEVAALSAGAGFLAGMLFCKEEPTPEPAPAPEPVVAPPPPPPPPPPAPEPPAEGTKIETLEGALFDFDKATLKPAALEKLGHAHQVLMEHPGVKLSVEGHTDSVGTDAYNEKLSERRAQAVVDYLVSSGIDAGRLTAVGYGEGRPVASNDTAEGRAQNRRVELVVSDNGQ